MRRLLLILLTLGLFAAQPAAAAVVITFWSHDQDNDFPHTFFELRGTPDAGGAALDENHGFTAKTVTPAILIGSVAGEVDSVQRGYMRRSDAQFAVTLTDAQLASIQALVAEWRVDTKYNLNRRNCVHFVAEALRRSGLTVPDLPRLMKKPKTFLIAVGRANEGRVAPIGQDGAPFLAARDAGEAGAAGQPRLAQSRPGN